MAKSVVPLDSDGESERGPQNLSEKAPSKDAMDVDEEGNEGQGEGEDDGPEEEYEIEKILDAKLGTFPHGRMGYLVKWKGYGEEHNSWVDEDDAGNAQDLIVQYWAKNKKGGRKSMTASAARPSTTKGRKSSVAREESSEVEEVRPKKRGRPPKARNDPSDEAEAEDDARDKKKPRSSASKLSKRESDDEYDFTSMKPWSAAATWEHIVDHIDTVERTDDGKLMVYFTLKNRKGRAREESTLCKDKMPRKLLDFYETNLRWRASEE